MFAHVCLYRLNSLNTEKVSLNNPQKSKTSHIIIDQYQQQVANSSFICCSLFVIVVYEIAM
jgi:hypothetical protein